jgi:hypothetical protein
MFVSNDKLEKHDEKESMMKTDNLASRLALIWELDSGSSSQIKKTILEEHSYLKQMMPLMDTDVAEHLRVIESSLAGGRDEAFVKENIIKAWIHCQEQRIKLLYRNSLGTQFVPPSTLCTLRLCNCSITDWALTICLGGLSSLNHLKLQGIMSLTTLPSEEVFQHLKKMCSLVILECWCIRSLGGINGAASLLSVYLSSCPSLGLARGVESMPLSLEELDVSNCVLASETVYDCKSSVPLSIGHLTSLKTLKLSHLPDLCMLEGLSSLQLHELRLVLVPKLSTKYISHCRVKKSLTVSSSIMLNDMLSTEGFAIPGQLTLESCNEPFILFERSDNLSSIQHLCFMNCGIQSLPSLKDLSCLESLNFWMCPNMLSLPALPTSIRRIRVSDCELLKESCQPNGESWSKIAHIRWKEIE